MSRDYTFCAMLDLNYSEKNILSILENGAKSGCIYKYWCHIDSECKIINTHDGLASLWKLYLQQSPPLISLIYKKQHFNLWVYNRNDKVYLYIGRNHTAWKKRYDLCAWYGINFYRYQNFMLRLIGNNVITYFETYEYFNEAYYPESIEYNNKIYVKLYTYWPYDVYHHLKVNGKILGVIWLDTHKQPINLKSKDNAFEEIFFNEEAPPKYWYAKHHNMMLKFTHPDKRTFIIEPMSIESSMAIDQAQLLDGGLRTIIELFRNTPVFRLITFKTDEDILNINKMDE